MEHLDDSALIELFFERSEGAILHTKKKYSALCRTIAYRVLGNVQDAEECENDVYLRLWDSIPPNRPISLKAYLSRIARNLALDRYSYNTAACRSSGLTQSFDELQPWLPAFDSDPERMVEAEHIRQVVNDFLRGQSQESRRFFLRRYWYGETIREIAQQCCVSEGKVKTSLSRTRERLRAQFEKERICI